MTSHVPAFDNKNKPIVDVTSNMLQRSFFNRVVLNKGEKFTHHVKGYESCITVCEGTCNITVDSETYKNVGSRNALFEGKPDSVYVPLDMTAEITCISDKIEIFIAAGRAETVFKPFRVAPEDVDVVQYGSDDTKTHRKIYHILGQKQHGMVDKLLVSELFTVGQGGWSGFPPHKHHVDRLPEETNHEEIYHYKFNPPHGFAAQFAYVEEDDFGPVYHVKDGSTFLLDNSYHPVVVAPGFTMYYFTILVGKSQRSLTQYFEPAHKDQLKTIPGIMDMVAKFK